MTAATVYLAVSLAGIVLLLALGRLINPPAWWALPDPYDGEDEPLWCCACGSFVAWVWDCPACGHAPPWGCHDEICPRHGPGVHPALTLVSEVCFEGPAPGGPDARHELPDPDDLDEADIDLMLEG